MVSVELLSNDKTKSICTSHHCPECGVEAHVTVERVLEGEHVRTRCHCRACGHSWDPQDHPMGA
jgi:DNA-directed RNA polymerase subunit M/transcription elongation factor TFIIS